MLQCQLGSNYPQLQGDFMANTRNDVLVPQAVWTNLYASSGITVGQPVVVINKGVVSANIAVSLAAPASTTVGVPLFGGVSVGNTVSVDAGASGLWAYAISGSVPLLVQD
jgi:hypothetical protein